jgi:hypothetical protein
MAIVSMKIKCKVDFENLIRVMKASPQLLNCAKQIEFDCGWFTCDTADEVLAMLREMSKPSDSTT